MTYFDQIYIISGNWTTIARQEHWKREMESVGITLDKIQVWQGVLDPVNGHRGAWLAHNSLIKRALALKQDCVLIFEDDVEFTTYFRRNARSLSRSVLKFLGNADSWEIFFLGSNSVEMQAVSGSGVFVRLHSWALLAYVLSSKGMSLFHHDYPNAFGRTIDGISFSSNYAFGIFPSVAVHPSGSYSDTDKRKRETDLQTRWSYNEEILHTYAVDPKKCWPTVAKLENFGNIDKRWYKSKNVSLQPVVTCH